MDELLSDFIKTLDVSFKQHLSAASDVSKLTVSQTFYIEAIHTLDEPTVTQLAERLGITKASVTAGVNKLVRRGYVTKTRSDRDKRVFYLSLTPASEKMIQAKSQVLDEYGASVRAVLTDDEAKQLEVIITKLVRHFQADD